MIVTDKRESWLRLLFGYHGSTLSHIRNRLLAVAGVALIVTLLHHEGMPFPTIGPAPFTIVGLPLGVFLGFRNNASYERFWEGRKLWGTLVNVTRTWARQLELYLALDVAAPRTSGDRPTPEEVRQLSRELVVGMIAYVHLLRMHLRDVVDLASLDSPLQASEMQRVEASLNRPVAVLDWLSRRLRAAFERGLLHPYHLQALERTLARVTDVQGGCERIRNTPIPYATSVLLHRIVAAYCFALPFGLVATAGAWTPMIALLVSYAFFGLDDLGQEMEEPFGLHLNDLPLDQLSRMIEINLRQTLGETEVPEPLQPVGGVLT